MDDDKVPSRYNDKLVHLLETNDLIGLNINDENYYIQQNIEIMMVSLDHQDVYKRQQLSQLLNSCFKKKSKLKTFTKKDTQQPESFSLIRRKKLNAIINLIEYLKLDDSSSADGLFRISGSRKRQVEIDNMIDKEKDLVYIVNKLTCNSHDLAGILKKYISELREPLLTKSFLDYFAEIESKWKNISIELLDNIKSKALNSLFLLLPPINRYILKKLIELLAIVARNESNRMDAKNLSVIFTPSICAKEVFNDCADYSDKLDSFISMVQFVIDKSDTLFEVSGILLEEVKTHQKINEVGENAQINNKNDAPSTPTFCQRIDSKQYRKEALANTNKEIATLYQQIQDMPEGKEKKYFLDKFHHCYPGTQVFVPKNLQDALSSMTII